VQVLDGSIGHDDARNRIRNTLYTGGTNDWDGIEWVRFQDQTLINVCPAPHSAQPIRIYFYVVNNVNPTYCQPTPQSPDPAGCAKTTFPYEDIQSGHFGYDPPQYEYRAYRIYIETGPLTNSTNFIVNHETGHALGLRDGGPGYDGTGCTGSVMHSYGCSNEPWPSQADRNSVESLVPPGAGGAGIKG
jgi:hypothetical protein